VQEAQAAAEDASLRAKGEEAAAQRRLDLEEAQLRGEVEHIPY